jgi:tyrosyl-tRNA synthetase
MALGHFQRAGHRPIALVGGGTTMIGDPTDKKAARRIMSTAEIDANAQAIKGQLSGYLDFSAGGALLVDNAEWLRALNYLEFLRDYGRYFSVNEMLRMETYRTRLESGLSFLEFNYALLQGYDFLELFRRYDCTLQVGGSDQWSNMLAGADLIRRCESKTAYVLTHHLITDASGEKMGKTSAGEKFWLDPAQTSPYDYYQFWINADDRDVARFLALFTLLPMDEVRALAPAGGGDARAAKRRLAFEATRLAHGEEQARKAQSGAALFSSKPAEHAHLSDSVSVEILSNIPSFELPAADLAAGVEAFDLFHRVGLAKSRGEARRLIEGGGAYVGGRAVAASNERVTAAEAQDGRLLLRAGKKKYLLLRLV